MHCCDGVDQAIERGAMFHGEKSRIDDGRILNELDTEYFIRAATAHGYDYYGINYCPFCGRSLGRGLWIAEKKK